MPFSNSYLLVSRIGSKSLHDRWLRDPHRSFDVMLSCYDPKVAPVTEDIAFWEFRPGPKVRGYGDFLAERADLWKRYDYICLMDEDIDVDAQSLRQMFDLCSEYKLKIAQPSLTLDSHFTYAALIHQAKWRLRHVNFIEMMCPVFRRDILETVAPLYEMGYESGIDLIWCNAVYEDDDDFAVLDAVQIRHTEPIGLQKAANGFSGSRRYEDDIYGILSRFGLPWLPCVPYAAIDLRGRKVRSKLNFTLSALSLLRAVLRQKPYISRLRSILVHLKQLQIRTFRNIRIDMTDKNAVG